MIITFWSGIVTALIFFVVDKLCGGIRVDPIYEEVGLDIAQLGVTVVLMPKNKLEKEIKRVLDHENKKKNPNAAELDAYNHGDDELDQKEVAEAEAVGPSIFIQ